jgi:hypothetical protein
MGCEISNIEMFGQIRHPSSRRSNEDKNIFILSFGHSKLLFVGEVPISKDNLAILKPMVQTICKLVLRCKR